MVAELKEEKFSNVAELHSQLSHVPLHRISLIPFPGTATEYDVLQNLDHGSNRIFELISGTLVEKAVGIQESMLAMWIVHQLLSHVEKNNLGIVTGPDGGIRMLQGNVRFPDVSFFRWESFPNDEIEEGAIWNTFPALAVEVLSASNTAEEINQKISELFEGGTKLVWIINPSKKNATVYTSPHEQKTVNEKDNLFGDNILPGFQMSLAELFSKTRKKPRK